MAHPLSFKCQMYGSEFELQDEKAVVLEGQNDDVTGKPEVMVGALTGIGDDVSVIN